MAKVGRIYVPLDVNFFDDDGSELSDEAALAFVKLLCLAKRLKSDGSFTRRQLEKEIRGDGSAVLEELLTHPAGASLVEAKVEANVFLLRAWGAWNKEAKEIEELRIARSEAGRKGGLSSGRTRANKKEPADPPQQVEATCLAVALAPSNTETETEVEKEKKKQLHATTPGASSLAAKPPSAPRRDLLFEAIADECGIDWRAGLTTSARSSLNRAVSEIRKVGGTPEQVVVRAAAYRKAWPQTRLTPPALAKHWPELDPSTTTSRAHHPANPRRAPGVPLPFDRSYVEEYPA